MKYESTRREKFTILVMQSRILLNAERLFSKALTLLSLALPVGDVADRFRSRSQN